jgi:hypothetical protein
MDDDPLEQILCHANIDRNLQASQLRIPLSPVRQPAKYQLCTRFGQFNGGNPVVVR